jgi:acyl carrier protein
VAEKTENENIADKVIGIVANQLDVEKEKIKPETSFINDLGADSLDIVELVMEFEEAFEMSIPDEDAEKIRTVGDAINYIKEHQGK